MNDNEIVAVSLPKKLFEEWKFLIQVRQEVEGRTLDPVEVLRQAIATEAYLWQQKKSEVSERSTKAGRIAGVSKLFE